MYPAYRLVTLLAIAQSFGLIQPARAADSEIAEGLPEHLMYLYTGSMQTAPTEVSNQLFANARRWEAGRKLRVCYFQGNAGIAHLVREVASEWNKYSSVTLDFGDPTKWPNCLSPNSGFYQIRIGFATSGHWSAVGSDSEVRLDSLQPSMNLQSFNSKYFREVGATAGVVVAATDYDKSVILHEFGHALGLLHEQQNPQLKCYEQIKWTGPGNVYEYYLNPPNRWDPPIVDRNLGFVWQFDPDYKTGTADVQSVMMYNLPAEIFKDGKDSPCANRRNLKLSKKDTELVASLYPRDKASQPSEEQLPPMMARPAANAIGIDESEDVTRRIVVDLQSEDVFTRRNARIRLASVLPALPPTATTLLVNELLSGNYRQQLGLAVALANTPKTFQLPAGARARVGEAAGNVSDPTLRKQLQIANTPKLSID